MTGHLSYLKTTGHLSSVFQQDNKDSHYNSTHLNCRGSLSSLGKTRKSERNVQKGITTQPKPDDNRKQPEKAHERSLTTNKTRIYTVFLISLL